MNASMRSTLTSIWVAWLATALLATPSVAAQDYNIDWWTIDSGGEMFTTGGGFELSGTIGQHDAASSAMTGGGYTLVGGFWAVTYADEPCFGDLDGDGEIGLADLAQLLANYGVTSGAAYEDGDLDADGDVDLSDLATLLSVYGTMCP